MNNYIGQRIARFRKNKRFKQYGFGDYIGCSQSHIWNIEKGNAIPDYLLLLKMADVLGITIEELTKGDTLQNHQGEGNERTNIAYIRKSRTGTTKDRR